MIDVIDYFYLVRWSHSLSSLPVKLVHMGRPLRSPLHLVHIGPPSGAQKRCRGDPCGLPVLWAMRIGRDKSGSYMGFIPPDIAPLFVLFARLHVLALL